MKNNKVELNNGRDARNEDASAEKSERDSAVRAAVLGCTAKAVETRLYRARQTLRERLARWLK